MNYDKLNKIKVDGNDNIVIQDVTGSTVTINYNDSDALKAIFEKISVQQSFEIKELIGNQHKDILLEIRKIQEQIDQQNVTQKAEESISDLDAIFKELNQIKVDGLKKRLLTNYKMLREYEEMLILEDDPRRKTRYQKEIETIQNYISKSENELKTIAKSN